YFYVRPKPFGTRPDMLVAGLFLGTAMFSKQFAVVMMIAIVVWELLGKERSRLTKSDFMLFLLGAGLVLTPFYGYHLLHNPGYLLYTQFHGSASMAGLGSGLTLSVLLSEIFWGCSPIVLFGGLAGLSLMLLQPTRHQVLVCLLVFAYFIFYLFLHKHSYYFLGMVPFLCLCATELSGRMPRKLYAASLTIALAAATSLSAYQLAGCKYGFTEFKNIGKYVNRYDRPVVMVDQSVYNSYAPLLKYYGENATLMLRDSELSPSSREMLRTADRIFYLSDFPLGGNRAEIFPIKGIRHGLKLGSRVYIHTPANIHLFAPSRPARSEGSKIIGTFGPFVKLEQTSFYLIAQPPF
ncbi:MAG: hypothetical protein JSV16_13890, partial [Candidatus Hydrogenedentota bacterium]